MYSAHSVRSRGLSPALERLDHLFEPLHLR